LDAANEAKLANERRDMAELARTVPSANGESPLAKRSPKGMFPSTWQGRTLKVEYIDGNGMGQSTTGTFLETYPTGPILSIAGAKTLFNYDRIVLYELQDELAGN
jgi:hypothetical protein